MNRELFQDALSSIIITSDFVEFIESGKSFIIDTLIGLGYSKEFAQSFLIEKGMEQQDLASTLMDEIVAADLESEFERWSDQDEVFQERRQGIINALELGASAANDPYRFH